jgi:hypothetical protein
MKIAFLSVTALLIVLFSSFTHANNERPILGKYNHPGFVMREHYQATACEVFAGGYVVKSISKGTPSGEILTTQEAHKMRIGVDEVRRLMSEAIAEKIEETDNYMCDGPSTSMIAYVEKNVSPEGMQTLYATGGCGTPRLRTIGVSSKKLFELLAEFCPTTY